MIPATSSGRWYYAKDQKKMGPVSLAQLRRLLAERVLKPEDMVFQEGTTKWRPLAEVAGATAGRAPVRKRWPLALARGAALPLFVSCLGCGLAVWLFGWAETKKDVSPVPLAAVPGKVELPGLVNEESGHETVSRGNQEPPAKEAKESELPRDPEPAPDSPKQRPSMVPQLGHTQEIWAVAFSPSGKQMLTGSEDKTARLWDAGSKKEIGGFVGHTGKVRGVAFSPDGTQVLTGSVDKTARLWETTSGKEIRVFAHGGPIMAVAFSPDGKQVLTATAEKAGGAYPVATAWLWDAATGTKIRAFRHTHRENTPTPMRSVAFSPDGAQVLTGSGYTARLWDAVSGKEIRVVARLIDSGLNHGLEVAFSPDGKLLLTGANDSTARVWDAASGKQIHVLQMPKQVYSSQVKLVAFSPNGKQILTLMETSAAGPNAWLWDTASGAQIRAFKGSPMREDPYAPKNYVARAINCAVFSPDGTRVLTAGGSKEALVWDVATGRDIGACNRLGRQSTMVICLAFAPSGNQVVIGHDDWSVRVWDLTSGRQTRGFHDSLRGHRREAFAVAFSPDGQQLLAGSSNAALLWDVAGGKLIRTFQGHAGWVWSVAFSPDGKQVLTGCVGTVRKAFGGTDNTARLWDAASGAEIRIFAGHGERVNAVAFAPDGRHVLTGSTDKTARLWDLATGQAIRRFEHTGLVTAVAFSPDGSQVLTGSATAKLWETASGKTIHELKGHAGYTTSVAFSRDGKQILTGGVDGAARLWDVATGKEIRTFQGDTYKGEIYAAISPDGKRILTGGLEPMARLWDVASGRELGKLLSGADGSWALVTADNYYMASKADPQSVAFRVGDRAFPFQQFDLKYNRPDKVAESIGLASPELIAAYRHAYQKRLKRMGLTENMVSGDAAIPEIAVDAGTVFTTTEKLVRLTVRAHDSRFLLDRLFIEVNGVPVHGAAGISLRKQPSTRCEQGIDVELSAGKNQIEVSVLNEKGAESLKETVSIIYDAPARKPNLYVVAVGVSDYQDERFRLNYADKDARDLADSFESRRDRFGEVKVQRILNRDATRENILKAKEFLQGSQVDDLMVVFFAGHGLLDSKLDYYFATADIDFKNPASRGLPYEAIEDLLDGIRARKKLLLMDTCHSGELDKDEIQIARSEKLPEGEIKVHGARGLDFGITPKVGLGNSYQLLQEMFADLRRGTGAVVIASAGGAEYALESAAWKNGVFTHAVLRGLKGEADRNKDGRVQVSELRDFVEQEVRRLTQNRQAPTARRENLVVDFTLD